MAYSSMLMSVHVSFMWRFRTVVFPFSTVAFPDIETIL